jgi:hypothetical protein
MAPGVRFMSAKERQPIWETEVYVTGSWRTLPYIVYILMLPFHGYLEFSTWLRHLLIGAIASFGLWLTCTANMVLRWCGSTLHLRTTGFRKSPLYLYLFSAVLGLLLVRDSAHAVILICDFALTVYSAYNSVCAVGLIRNIYLAGNQLPDLHPRVILLTGYIDAANQPLLYRCDNDTPPA